MSATAVAEFRNEVGGDLNAGVDGAIRDVLNPATGTVIEVAPEGTAAEIDTFLIEAPDSRIDIVRAILQREMRDAHRALERPRRPDQAVR